MRFYDREKEQQVLGEMLRMAYMRLAISKLCFI